MPGWMCHAGLDVSCRVGRVIAGLDVSLPDLIRQSLFYRDYRVQPDNDSESSLVMTANQAR